MIPNLTSPILLMFGDDYCDDVLVPTYRVPNVYVRIFPVNFNINRSIEGTFNIIKTVGFDFNIIQAVEIEDEL